MSNIYQNRLGIWQYRYTEYGKTHVFSLKTRNKKEAIRLQTMEDEKRLAPPDERKLLDLTTEECLHRHIQIKKLELKPSTIKGYVQIAQNLVQNFPERNITLKDIQQYVHMRQTEGVSNKTINEALVLLKRAVGLDFDLPRLKKTARRPETLGFYTLDDIKKLKEYFKNKPRYYLFFLTALYTGARFSELKAMKWEDVRGDVIVINSFKTATNVINQTRLVPIHRELLKALKQNVSTGLMFPSIADRPTSWAAKKMRKICKILGIQYKRFHGIRHTTATFLLDSGVSLRDVMSILGWTRMETAQKYIHYNDVKKIDISRLPY